MDVSGWTDEQIMQLPDHVFGPRYVVGDSENLPAGFGKYKVTTFSLPSKCIIWALALYGVDNNGNGAHFNFRISDDVPANHGAFMAYDPIFPDVENEADEDSSFEFTSNAGGLVLTMKHLVSTGGKKICWRTLNNDAVVQTLAFYMTISEVPTRIHSWQLSETAKDRW